jgi:CheY-like chemotaxis protein
MTKLQKLLIVEDNPLDADLIRETLSPGEDAEFEILNVDRLSKAVTLLQEKEVDVILLDLGLPDSSGIQTIKAMNRLFPHLPIVVITGNDDAQLGIDALKNGAQDYLVKGLTPPPRFHMIQVLQYAIQRNETEKKVRLSERFLRSSLDGLSAHIAILDCKGCIHTVNKAWETFGKENGIPQNTIWKGINYLDVCDRSAELGEADALEFSTGIRAVRNREKDAFEMDYSCHSPDRKRWFHCKVTPFPDKYLPYVILTHEDISVRHSIEKELRQAQKMESLGTLAGGVAHDFNNILTAILGFTSLIKEDAPLTSNLFDDLSEIEKAALRASDLVNQILTFSRMKETERKPLRLDKIIDEALRLLRSTIPTTIEMKVSIDRVQEYIHADPTQIHQIIMNLCTNASHAMEEKGGILEVSLKKTFIKPKGDKNHLDLKPGNFLTLGVKDTGYGIPDEIIDSIFDPYFTTKNLGEGTGLGLSMVQGIVKNCGGDIIVSSKPGKGALFTIFFPIMEQTKNPDMEKNDSPLRGGNEKILLIDDEHSILKVQQRILEHLGYDVTIENKSESAMEMIEKNPKGFDLVITDMSMPKMDGATLAQKAMQINPDLPVIICTGFSSVLTREKIRELGIRAVLSKPLSVQVLTSEIRKILDSN